MSRRRGRAISTEDEHERPTAIGFTDSRLGEWLHFMIFENEAFAFGSVLPRHDPFGVIEANNGFTWFMYAVRRRRWSDQDTVSSTPYPRWSAHRHRILDGLACGPVAVTIRDFLADPRRRMVYGGTVNLTEEEEEEEEAQEEEADVFGNLPSQYMDPDDYWVMPERRLTTH
jgi:hypothetical protein